MICAIRRHRWGLLLTKQSRPVLMLPILESVRKFLLLSTLMCSVNSTHHHYLLLAWLGIVAGEAAAYDTFKEIMDVVIEGWHGFKVRLYIID